MLSGLKASVAQQFTKASWRRCRVHDMAEPARGGIDETGAVANRAVKTITADT
ncbi:hypothetical protein [Gordonia sp. NPDC003376]